MSTFFYRNFSTVRHRRQRNKNFGHAFIKSKEVKFIRSYRLMLFQMTRKRKTKNMSFILVLERCPLKKIISTKLLKPKKLFHFRSLSRSNFGSRKLKFFFNSNIAERFIQIWFVEFRSCSWLWYVLNKSFSIVRQSSKPQISIISNSARKVWWNNWKSFTRTQTITLNLTRRNFMGTPKFTRIFNIQLRIFVHQ